jgi:aspartate--ammonia ligase
MSEGKAKLLRETAEIAFTEIKRFLEPRLMETLSLRRIMAPLFLPVGSPLLDARWPGVRIYLSGSGEEVELIGSLDVWLRGQLTRYDIAPGFGVFTIMNAIRPQLPHNSTSSPHVAAWAWQQAVEPSQLTEKFLVDAARKIHTLIFDTERMLLALFPHMHATVSKEIRIMHEGQLTALYPSFEGERRIYEHLYPESDAQDDASLRSSPMMLLVRDTDAEALQGEFWIWNRLLRRPVMVADIAARGADSVGRPSVGGNIYRGTLSLQLLQQDRLI